jgi:hypothetical protein
MSQSEIERLIGRALLDAEFRARLLEQPQTVIRDEQFDLTPEEIASLERIPPATVRSLARYLDQRLVQVGWWPYPSPPQDAQ